MPARQDASGWVSASGEVRRDATGLTLRPNATGTVSYVCPSCLATQVGAEVDNYDFTVQQHCHGCREPLLGRWLCAGCGLPRGWMVVACPHCGRSQAVCAPHWAQDCDAFTLDCTGCDTRYRSACIC